MNTKVLLFLLFVVLMTLMVYTLQKRDGGIQLKVGEKAPHFSLLNEQGESVSLSSYKGKKVALVFYPKPDTPGCIKEVCSIEDSFSKLQRDGITVFGISSGSLASMKEFKEKYYLSFPLLAANDETLRQYGVKGTLFSLFLPQRHTFLIDENGTIVSIIKDVDVDKHAEQILQGFGVKAE